MSQHIELLDELDDLIEGQHEVGGAVWRGYKVPTFNGTFDTRTNSGSDYNTLELGRIFDAAATPTCVPKTDAPAILQSRYNKHDARIHEVQRQKGRFVCIAGDVDKGDHCLEAIKRAVEAFVGEGVAFLIYSSASARPGALKWRVLIPLGESLPASAWELAQAAFVSAMADSGIELDQALTRTAQPVFLPNVPPERRGEDGKPVYYTHHITDGEGFYPDADGTAPSYVERVKQQRAKAEAEVQRQRVESRAKAEQRKASGRESLIDKFNAEHSIKDMLEQYKFEQGPGDSWRSPYQTSKSYATEVFDQRAVSLSASDDEAGLGRKCQAGRYFDCFDLFTHFEHGGDTKKALAALGTKEQRKPTQGPVFERLDELGVWDEFGSHLVVTTPRDTSVAHADTGATPRPSARLKVSFADELPDAYTPPDELVERLLVQGGATVLFGDSNSGKTFLVLDMAAAIARGVEWMGRKTEAGAVLYLAAESPQSVRSRLQAYQIHHGVKVPNFAIVETPINLFADEVDTDSVVDLVREIEASRGVKVRLIVGDTLARMSAGANENAGVDMGLVVERIDRIRTESAAHFLMIHHSGKQAANGARGWSGIRAAVDTEIEVTDSLQGRYAEVQKQRDLGGKGERLGFDLQVVEMGVTKWGRTASTCVVIPKSAPERAQTGPRLGACEGAIVEFLKQKNGGVRKVDVAKHFDGTYHKANVYRAIRSLLEARAVHEAVGMVSAANGGSGV